MGADREINHHALPGITSGWITIAADCQDDLAELKWRTAETSFHIGVLAGAMFAGCPDREIDRLERGLIHAIVSRGWRFKE